MSASAWRSPGWEHPEAWEVHIPSSASSISPPPSVLLPPPPLPPSSSPPPPPLPPPPHRPRLPPPPRSPRVSRARTRAKLRGNGCLCDRGGWAARSERRAAWVCNVRHVGHGVLNRGGTAEPRKKETDRERPRPGPARLCSRCYGPELALNRPADSERPSQIHPWELEAELLLFLADRIDLCCIF